MAIQFQVLGAPGRDNALWVEIQSGDAVYRLLFDCGEGCVTQLPVSAIHNLDAVFFSHFHIDHIAGFDSFFRHNFARPDRPVRLFGPQGACEVLAHRLRGFTWNLVADMPGEFHVTEFAPPRKVTYSFLTKEQFAVGRQVEETSTDGCVLDGGDFRVEAEVVDHGVPCLAYIAREAPRWNFNLRAVAELGLRPGPWMRVVRDEAEHAGDTLTIEGKNCSLAELRSQVLEPTPGKSIAYLTDFRLDAPAEDRLAARLAGCDTLVCENNFRNADRLLAETSFHMISDDVARLAARVNPQRLVLFHLSDRYTRDEWREQLEEVRAVFPRAEFPEAWPELRD